MKKKRAKPKVTKLKTVQKYQIIGDEVIAEIRQLLREAKKGEVTDIVVVARSSLGVMQFRSVWNGLEMVGGLERAKSVILQQIEEEAEIFYFDE